MAPLTRLNGRYEIKETIGEGGQGIVYRAFDLEIKSDVAIKTIKELLGPEQIELFRRECAVLRKLRHPNVVDLYDFGISEANGQEKPFFVMPFLPGVTLDKVIRNHAARLTPDRVVDIITQTARGLQAAHDLELIHRDIKPSNIFVLGDDSVKLIDFGVVHLTNQQSRTGLKGTLRYMSPEQLELNPPTRVSDVFSLAVVCYEALTRRRPFNGNTEDEIREAILRSTPPPISELNPAVSLALSQVVHAAMAKQPWIRTSTARQFAEELQRALHGQPIDRFDPVRIEPRIRRAQKALESSEYDFAAEILSELEAEGHIDPTIRSLRLQINQALRARAIQKALESAQHRFAETEYQLALQKVEEVLRLESTNAEALALKSRIDSQRTTQQIENWFRLAQDHIRNYAYNHARQALQNVLRLNATNTMAIQLLSDVDRRENEYLREHREKEELFKAALEAWERGDVSVALTRLERVLELDARAPDSASSESAVKYQNLYNQVRSEHDGIKNSYEEARQLLSENNFAGASSICERVLSRFPEQALFQALRFDIGERQRQHVSAFIVRIDRDVEAEPDLDRKVAILLEARNLYPQETHFTERLDKVTQRRDLVASITQKIRNLEERGQYVEAIAQLEILRAIYPLFPGMELEFDRIGKRRDQQFKVSAKARWLDQIDGALGNSDFSHGLTLLKSALIDFPDDAELLAQERLARDGLERRNEAIRVFESAQATISRGDVKGGLESLWHAHRLDDRNPLIQAVLVETLLRRASAELNADSTLSEQLVRQAITLDPESTQAKSLLQMVLDRNRDRAVDLILSGSREAQARGDLNAAFTALQEGLTSHPDEPRLRKRLEQLNALKRPDEKGNDAGEMRALKERIREAQDVAVRNSIWERSRAIAGKYPGDPEVASIFKDLEDVWNPASVSQDARRTTATAEIPVEAPDPKPARRKWLASLGVAAIAVILLISAIEFLLNPGKKTGPTNLPVEVEVTVDASVPGAHVFVDDQDRGAAPLTLKLAEGRYTIDARLPGYGSQGPRKLEVAGGTTIPPIMIPLEALRPVFRIFTEYSQGTLDNVKLTLDGTGYETAGLADGHHVLKLFNPVAGTVTVEFDVSAGQLPVAQIKSAQTLVLALATLADQGQLYSSSKSLKAGLNGPADQIVGELGIPLRGVKAGPNELTLDDGKNPRTESVDVAERNPALTILVGANPDAGNLEIAETGKVEGRVTIELAESKGSTRTQQLNSGKTTFVRLAPQTYILTILADGYESQKRQVTVSKGAVTTETFTLKQPLPTTAGLEIKRGTPDAEVYLDNALLGKLNGEGNLSPVQVSVGQHRIQLRKSDFEDGPVLDQKFNAGETTALSDQLLRQLGWIEFNVTPINSTITYSLIGGAAAPLRARNGDMPHVKAGRYSVTVQADGYKDANVPPVVVESGKGSPLRVTLDPVPASPKVEPPEPPRPKPVYGPEKLTGFRKLNDGDLQSEAAFGLFQEKLAGRYSFKIKMNSRLFRDRRPAHWIVNFIDRGNYIDFVIDEKLITYVVHHNGTETPAVSRQHGFSLEGDYYSLAIDVAAGGIVVSSGGRQISIVSPQADGSLLDGRFGFPRDEIIDQFKFAAN